MNVKGTLLRSLSGYVFGETMLSVTESGDEEANWELSERRGWFDKADGRQRTKTSVIFTSRDCLSSLQESDAV